MSQDLFPPIKDAAVSECPGGVCPVPWAAAIDEACNARPELKEDAVNHPSHYTDGGIECIEAIQAALTEEEFLGYLKGNIIKYVWRERMKGRKESLDKAGWYLEKASLQREAIDN